jgi:hypothetical protein
MGGCPFEDFADVVATGPMAYRRTRIFSYLPRTTWSSSRASGPADFVDTTPHRAKLPAAWRYIRVADLFYEKATPKASGSAPASTSSS